MKRQYTKQNHLCFKPLAYLILNSGVLVLVLGLGLAGCLPSNEIQAKAYEAATPNVIDAQPQQYVAHMFHKGKRLVWQQNQLNIYCSDEKLKPWVTSAFQPWSEALKSVHPLQLQFVTNPSQAHIRISLANTLDATIQVDQAHRRGYTAALTKPLQYDESLGTLQAVSIELAQLDSSGLPQTAETLQRVILHELGHALGLWGHSSNGFDVMSPNFYKGLAKHGTALHVSSNDVETLQALYQNPKAAVSSSASATSSPVRVTLDDLTREQAMMLKSPSWQGYWKLARQYRDSQQPRLAENAYIKVLQLKGHDSVVYLERVQALQLAGLNTEALALLTPIPSAYSTNGRLTLEKAWLMVKMQRINEARTYLKQALEQNPNLTHDEVTLELKRYL